MDATWKYTPATTKKSTCVDVEAQISLVNSLINNIYIYCSLHELCHAPVLLCSVIHAVLPTALHYTTLRYTLYTVLCCTVHGLTIFLSPLSHRYLQTPSCVHKRETSCERGAQPKMPVASSPT